MHDLSLTGTKRNIANLSLALNRSNLVEDLVKYHDQPFVDSSAIPTYLVSKFAREHVTVALTGDGGDELFAGYQRFRAALIEEKIPDSSSAWQRNALHL